MNLSLIVGVVLSLALVWALALVVFALLRPKDVPLRELVRVVPDVVRLLRSVITDATAPVDVRVVLGFLLVWIISPIDLIPEFIPVLGPIDDVIVAAVALRYTRRRLGIADLRRRWAGTDDGFALLVSVVGSN